MDLPRDSSDIQIALVCQACNGNGGIGHRKPLRSQGRTIDASFDECATCNGTGWTHKHPTELTAMELARLVQRLPSFP